MTQSAPDDRPAPAARLFVAGDFMLESHRESPVSDDLRRRIAGADLSVVNFEGVVGGNADAIPKTGPANRIAEEAPAVLRESGFDAVTLANNHAMDFGEAGLRETLRSCRAAGLSPCGAGLSLDEALEPVRTTPDGLSVAVFGFCEREFGITEGEEPGTAWVSHSAARQRVAEAADEVDAVVVLAHGGVEYTPLPPPQRQRQLREFVDAGADVVVGHHPHVPQGWEVYRGAPVFYSLGNFLYDHTARPKTTWGLAVDLSFSHTGDVSVELVPTEQVDGAVRELDRNGGAEEELQHLYRLTDITAEPETLRAYWQEVAVQLFYQRYHRWLRQATGARLRDQLRWPFQHVDREALWRKDRRGPMLVLLNLLRNESHRAVVETVLSVKVGESEDLRTPEVREEVRDLMSWTEDRPVYDRPSPVRTTLGALAGRLGAALSSPRRALLPRRDNDNA